MGQPSQSKGKGLRLHIVIMDSNFAKIGTFKCLSEDFPKILKTIHYKFGISTREERVKDKKRDKDIDWLRD